ncbi:hypothetical protein LTR91_005150 [Friedmanniomyces endolithicus]|uniref:Eukaryotic translation initiation factor 4G1 eIF4E-binding domain-containing protein n=1 Tax=Friedmanniomyces endolithicus TaxID=329885 RepID=A0AAN6QY65_9PEZI|nr:hypothetical protein LTR94_000193 [Friedmanniomyces endolithicus]KAK0805225.1 hypothetical protein LTR75_007361 [Friedmanniomyces endolithicus]KAK0815139.1 hypothetical protein LTR38_002433 [Friedmanniomyces endolithicus]KAK0879253.1 hypothetical protein LTR87_006923 [Friedmanniomyces endolithicus]KAK1002054.1 hypothetical protein LTR91_005150 [Friedmanniomyces endolithicus]
MANPRAATGFNSARIGHLRAQLATQIHSIVLLDAELIIARAEFARCVVRHDGLMEVLRPQPLTAGLQQVHTTVVGNEHGSGVTAHINVAIASLQAGLDALQVDSGQYSSRKQAKHKPQREEAWLDTAVFTAFFTYVEVAESNEKDSNGHIKCSHCSQYVAQFGFGSCNHKVCYDCALTGGTFHGDGTCLVCEAHMPFIVFTDDCTKFYSIYTSEEDSRQDADLRIFSTAQGSLIAAMTLLRFACPENCPHELRLGWEDLRRHLLIEHDRYLCKHCASAKGLSPHVLEQHSDILAGPSADLRPTGIKAARYLASWEQFDHIYPNGIMGPRMVTKNDHAPRIYQPEFLLQFRRVCKHKPASDWGQRRAELGQAFGRSGGCLRRKKARQAAAKAAAKVALRLEKKQLKAARKERAKEAANNGGRTAKGQRF